LSCVSFIRPHLELLSRSFEDILAFFRLELPDLFRDELSARSLILRAAKMKVTSRKLAKYEKDYLEMKAQEALEEDPMTVLDHGEPAGAVTPSG
jgi:hypothetical protein